MQVRVRFYTTAYRDGNASQNRSLEAVVGYRHPVVATEHKRRRVVITRVVGRKVDDVLTIEILDIDLRANDRRAGGVLDDADDVACSLLCMERRRTKGKHGQKGDKEDCGGVRDTFAVLAKRLQHYSTPE